MKLTPEQVAHVRGLENEFGMVTPSQLVTDARRKESPLHPLFEWDRAKAAMGYWITQAREILGAVKIVITTETTTFKAPLYVHDPDLKGAQGYSNVTRLRDDADRARRSLIYTLEVAAGHVRRAQDLAVSLNLMADIDRLLEEIVGLQRALRAAA